MFSGAMPFSILDGTLIHTSFKLLIVVFETMNNSLFTEHIIYLLRIFFIFKLSIFRMWAQIVNMLLSLSK